MSSCKSLTALILNRFVFQTILCVCHSLTISFAEDIFGRFAEVSVCRRDGHVCWTERDKKTLQTEFLEWLGAHQPCDIVHVSCATCLQQSTNTSSTRLLTVESPTRGWSSHSAGSSMLVQVLCNVCSYHFQHCCEKHQLLMSHVNTHLH